MKLKILFPFQPEIVINDPPFIPRVGEYVYGGKYPSPIVDKVTYDLVDRVIYIQLRTE